MKSVLASGIVVLMSLAASAVAQEVSSEMIIEALTPKPLTRGIAPSAGMNATDRALIEALTRNSRGISIVERNQVAEIVEEHKLPSIDLEIYFDHDSAEISAAAKPDLVELGVALRSQALKKLIFLVSGHTDATGSSNYNLMLSDRRAASVRDFLIQTFAIEQSRLIAIGFGEEQLRDVANPQADKNRRVTIISLVR